MVVLFRGRHGPVDRRLPIVPQAAGDPGYEPLARLEIDPVETARSTAASTPGAPEAVDLSFDAGDSVFPGSLPFDLGRAPPGEYRLEFSPLGESWTATIDSQGLDPSVHVCAPPAETWLEFRLTGSELVLPEGVSVRAVIGSGSILVPCTMDPLESGYHVLSAPGDPMVSFRDPSLAAPARRITVESGWNRAIVDVMRAARFDIAFEEEGKPFDPGRDYWRGVQIEPSSAEGSIVTRGSSAPPTGGRSRLVVELALGSEYRVTLPPLPDGRTPEAFDLVASEAQPRSIRIELGTLARR